MSLAENPVFLLLFFLLLLSLFQITLESSLKIERHMIVRGEDMQRRNMVVVFVAGTIYHVPLYLQRRFKGYLEKAEKKQKEEILKNGIDIAMNKFN